MVSSVGTVKAAHCAMTLDLTAQPHLFGPEIGEPADHQIRQNDQNI